MIGARVRINRPKLSNGMKFAQAEGVIERDYPEHGLVIVRIDFCDEMPCEGVRVWYRPQDLVFLS